MTCFLCGLEQLRFKDQNIDCDLEYLPVPVLTILRFSIHKFSFGYKWSLISKEVLKNILAPKKLHIGLPWGSARGWVRGHYRLWPHSFHGSFHFPIGSVLTSRIQERYIPTVPQSVPPSPLMLCRHWCFPLGQSATGCSNCKVGIQLNLVLMNLNRQNVELGTGVRWFRHARTLNRKLFNFNDPREWILLI